MKALPQHYDNWRGGPQGGAGAFGGPGSGTGGGGMGGGDTFYIPKCSGVCQLMVCQQKCSYMYLFLTIMPLGFQFNHPMDGSGFFIGGCGGFGGGAQMSGSTPQADGSQNQPTNKQNQSSSQMQQQLIQIGEHNYPSVTIKLKTLRCTCIQ